MISSRHNSRLKDIRHLRKCKDDRALLEGFHLVNEALDARLDLTEVLISPACQNSPEGEALMARLPLKPLLVDEDLLASLLDGDSPRGLAAVVSLPRLGVEHLPLRPEGTYLFVDRLQDPGNLGALARVAEASGAAGMALSPSTVHPNHPRALRASAGSLLRLPISCGVEPDALGEHLKSLGASWVALVPSGGNSLFKTEFSGSVILALGAEGGGLRREILDRAHLRLAIPMNPPVESLNVTVAAALVLYEIARHNLES